MYAFRIALTEEPSLLIKQKSKDDQLSTPLSASDTKDLAILRPRKYADKG